jgi:Na+/proline symporter/signal transduction histidine kinase
MSSWVILAVSLGYLIILFAVAYYAEYRGKTGSSLTKNAYVYSLSLAVYCTAWTYYGSVGRASENGLDFLAIYLGPSLVCVLFWPLYYKILKICKTQRIISLADFISTRYGKDTKLSVLVTLFCLLGIIPYIALQLKAIQSSIATLTGSVVSGLRIGDYFDITNILIVTGLTVFIILFGARSVDKWERHEGLVVAIAFESVVKLVAFITAGVFITYWLFNGFGDIYTQSLANPAIHKLFSFGQGISYTSWMGILFLSMLAFIFLPRQFQVGLIENEDERYLDKASWLFPLYLFLINLFVLPIALAGKIILAGEAVNADTYVLALPLRACQNLLSLLIYIGGFSAATSMIIVETIALSTMISNNIVTPYLLRHKLIIPIANTNVSNYILLIRRVSILFIVAMAMLYDIWFVQNFSLVSIGLISFAAVAQFAPSVLIGLYWREASKRGATMGMIVGFIIWFFTAILPTLIAKESQYLTLINDGLFGLSWLRPYSLFGLENIDPITHCFFWSLFFNVFVFLIFSVYDSKTASEVYYANLFVNIHNLEATQDEKVAWRGQAKLKDLHLVLSNFMGAARTERMIEGYAYRNKIDLTHHDADPRLVNFIERILGGIIGSSSARILVSSITKEEEIKMHEVINMLRESQQIMHLNKELRRKSAELLKATEELTKVNIQLKEVDAMKDEFLYTVTHELRTPVTSIRAMAEILQDHQDITIEEREMFLDNIARETVRLSHLITQVLNLERYESGRQKLNIQSIDLKDVIKESVDSVMPLCAPRGIHIKSILPDTMLLLRGDPDLLLQVFSNLLSNAIKFVEDQKGEIEIRVVNNYNEYEITVKDNGRGIHKEDLEFVFDKFFQARNQMIKKPQGTGLGLAICKRIVEMHGGHIRVVSTEGKGASFVFGLHT